MDEATRVLERRIAVLEQHMRALAQSVRANGGVTTLTAPVRITDANGSVLAEIRRSANDTGIRIFDDRGQPAATLGVDGTRAGYLAIRDAAGTLVASLDVEQAGARLILEDHDRRGGVVVFGGDSGENSGGGININGTAGGPSISLWSTPDGGEVSIFAAGADAPIVVLPARRTPASDD